MAVKLNRSVLPQQTQVKVNPKDTKATKKIEDQQQIVKKGGLEYTPKAPTASKLDYAPSDDKPVTDDSKNISEKQVATVFVEAPVMDAGQETVE